jgi:hypothetical protein
MLLTETVFVQANFRPHIVREAVKIPTGETTTSFFGLLQKDETRTEWQERQKGYSSQIDGQKLASDVSKAIRDKSRDGFTVQSVTPITSGDWAYNTGELHSGANGMQGHFGYSYGYSFTEGVMIVFIKETNT